ncbi:hypothetical protein C8J57DRAFT_1317657 [Mycena rebaudengoi]|nr:hypothetical protein C8J57DRAFT_1317657 [Mycena rebaudengoi]
MPSLALLVGLLSSSYFTFGSVSGCYLGAIPAIHPKNTTLHIADRLAIFKFSCPVGARHMGGASFVTGVALSLAAYLSPERALRKLLLVGAVAALSIIPFTVLAMIPINNELLRLAESTRGLDVNSVEGKRQEKHALDKLDQWRTRHRARIAVGVVPWLSVVAVLVAPDSVISSSYVVG